MSAGKRKLPARWFGYHKRETDSYLRKLESMQNLETIELESKIKEQRSQNAQLKTKIDELSKQSATSIPSDSEMVSLLFERLERSVQAIDRQGEAEAESLRRLMERKRERHERKMAEWESRFETSREALDFLLEEAHELIGKVKMKERPDSIELLEREAEEAMQVAPERIPDLDETDEAPVEEREAAERTANAKVLQFKLRSILKEAAASEESILDTKSRMTADGMSLEEEIQQEESESDRKYEKKRSQNASAFWGDLEPYLDDTTSGNEGEKMETALLDEDDLEFPTMAASMPEPPSEPNPADNLRENVHVSKESLGLTEEILSIQNRYIVGKVSGENLYAADGRLIVSKGQTITSGIVQLADAEGKLPELIIHMVIPGFGVDPS